MTNSRSSSNKASVIAVGVCSCSDLFHFPFVSEVTMVLPKYTNEVHFLKQGPDLIISNCNILA